MSTYEPQFPDDTQREKGKAERVFLDPWSKTKIVTQHDLVFSGRCPKGEKEKAQRVRNKGYSSTDSISPVVPPRVSHQEVLHLGLEEVATVAFFEAQRLEPALVKPRRS